MTRTAVAAALREQRGLGRQKGMATALRLPSLTCARAASAAMCGRMACFALVGALVASTGCSLRRIGSPEEPVFTVEFVSDDDAFLPSDAELAVGWRVAGGVFFVASEGGFDGEGTLSVYEAPPAEALDVYGGVARLDFFKARREVLNRIAAGEAPGGRLASSRASLWWIDDVARADVVPIDNLNVDDVPFYEPVVLRVDSADPAARRCGDNVLEELLPACAECRYDERPVDDEPACCADVRAAVDACGALVDEDLLSQELPVRVRVLP